MDLKLLSWNVNGIRAVEKKGFLEWFSRENPDILALQETKAHPDQMSEELKNSQGYYSYWSAAKKKGYSGVGVYTKEKPLSIEYGFGEEEFDSEGRILVLEYPNFFFLNIYFPNGKKDEARLDFKLRFYREFLRCLDRLKAKKNTYGITAPKLMCSMHPAATHEAHQLRRSKTIIVTGVVNTAHTEIDLARPKENETVSGFLPEELAWLDTFANWGLVDTFRMFTKEGGHYTWWDYKSGARERNVGWRIDYFYIDKDSAAQLKEAFILKDIYGSDHCPIGIVIKI
jgi:exodeoxyribonuclease III